MLFLLLSVSTGLLTLAHAHSHEHHQKEVRGESCSICVQLGQLSLGMQKAKLIHIGALATTILAGVLLSLALWGSVRRSLPTLISLRVELNM